MSEAQTCRDPCSAFEFVEDSEYLQFGTQRFENTEKPKERPTFFHDPVANAISYEVKVNSNSLCLRQFAFNKIFMHAGNGSGL